jgi:hypothetical protein
LDHSEFTSYLGEVLRFKPEREYIIQQGFDRPGIVEVMHSNYNMRKEIMMASNYDSDDKVITRKSRFVCICFPQFSLIISLERDNFGRYLEPRYIANCRSGSMMI